MADAKSGSTRENDPFGIPNFDLGKLLEQFRWPGLDLERLMEEQRRNIEAVQQANQAVTDGWAQLAEKQAQVFRESLEQWQKAAQEQFAGKMPDTQEQSELARQGLEQALDNMREMAEITAQSQAKAMEIMRKRIDENVKAYFGAGQSAEQKKDT